MSASTCQPSKSGPHLLALFLLAASCTSEPAPTPVPSPTQGSEAVAPTVSPSLKPTSGPQPSATPTPELPIQFVLWPEQGNLLLPSDIEVNFETSLDDLAPGGYVLRWEVRDARWLTMEAVSYPLREVAIVARVPDTSVYTGLEMIYFGDSIYVSPAGGPPPMLRVFDLAGKRSWRIGPLCGSISEVLSPSGKYFLSYCETSCPACENNITPGMSPDLEVFEVISVTEGIGLRVGLPSKDERQPVRLSWFGEHELIASRVWIDERFFVCLIDVKQQTARCPYSFKEPYVMRDHVVIGEHLPFVLSGHGGPLEALIMPRVCLTQGECDGIVDLGEMPGDLRASPSGERFVLISSGPLPEDKVVAFLEPPGWKVNRLIQLSDSYGLDAWCPDEGCVLLEGSGFPRPSYRLDPDGSLTLYPYDNIIGSFTIP